MEGEFMEEKKPKRDINNWKGVERGLYDVLLSAQT